MQDLVVTVPIASLLPADSPRIGGEDVERIHALAAMEGLAPPIVVHRATMQVVDGMHRLRAALLRGRDVIEVRFVDGAERDVFPLAVELNSRHGLPLSTRDRTSAAGRVVRSHPQWSDRAIAELTGLSAKTVAAIRRRSTTDVPQLHGRIGRDGKVRPLDAVGGRRTAARLMAERPGASLRDIAREAGVSAATVLDVRRRLRSGADPVPGRLRQADPLVVLRNDPSLRFSAIGRTVLRLLDAHSIPAAGWARLADAVPAHCAVAVARMARNCAHQWLAFADQVAQKRRR